MQLTRDELQAIDSVAIEFEQAWRAGDEPTIADFVVRAAGERMQPDLFRELLLLEAEYQSQLGARPDRQKLSEEFPQWRTIIDDVLRDPNVSTSRSVRETESGADGPKPPKLKSRVRSTAEAVRLPENVAARYQVMEVLGEGGFGQVLLCRDTDLDRKVAIKVARPDLFADQRHIQNFLREARTAAQVDDAHVVKIHDVIVEDQRCCIVMDFVDGESLADSDRQRSWREAAELMAVVARTVAKPHQSGIYHLDLKPANILVDKQGSPQITDFGLAMNENEQHERAGDLSGTPAYMSPEQVRGRLHHVDGRADIWSLGVILYELAVGRKPFLAPSSSQLFELIELRAPKPLRQIDEAIPLGFDQVCMKCLEKNPADRYQTAGDLATDLTAVARGKKPPVVNATQPSRRAPWLVAAIAICIVAAIAGVAMTPTLVSNLPYWGTLPQEDESVAATPAGRSQSTSGGSLSNGASGSGPPGTGLEASPSPQRTPSKRIERVAGAASETSPLTWESGAPIASLHQAPIVAACFSSDATMAATMDRSGAVRMYTVDWTTSELYPAGGSLDTGVQRPLSIWIGSSDSSLWVIDAASPIAITRWSNGERKVFSAPAGVHPLAIVSGVTPDEPFVVVSQHMQLRLMTMLEFTNATPAPNTDPMVDDAVIAQSDKTILVSGSMRDGVGPILEPFIGRPGEELAKLSAEVLPNSLALNQHHRLVAIGGYTSSTGVMVAPLIDRLEWQSIAIASNDEVYFQIHIAPDPQLTERPILLSCSQPLRKRDRFVLRAWRTEDEQGLPRSPEAAQEIGAEFVCWAPGVAAFLSVSDGRLQIRLAR